MAALVRAEIGSILIVSGGFLGEIFDPDRNLVLVCMVLVEAEGGVERVGLEAVLGTPYVFGEAAGVSLPLADLECQKPA